MELIWKELPCGQVIYSGVSQATAETRLPMPEGRGGAKILSYTGEAELLSCEAAEGEVRLEGVISVDLICSDGEALAFSASAPFKHSISAEGVKPGMRAEAGISLQSLEVSAEGGVCAVVDISACVISAGVRVVDGIAGAPDAEQQREELTVFERTGGQSCSFSLREDIEAPFASEVVYSEAEAVLRGVSPAGGGVCVEGTLYLSALVKSRSGALGQLCRAVPFSRELELEPMSPMWGEVRVCAHRMGGSGELGAIAAEVELNCRVWGRAGGRAEVLTDIFSPTLPFECTHAQIKTASYCGLSAQRLSLSERVTVPEGMPDAARVVYSTARPVVTSYGADCETLSAEGLIFARVIYSAESGELFSFCEDIPFSATMPSLCGTDAFISGVCACSCAGGGRSVELSLSLSLSASVYSFRSLLAVSGAEECPARAPFHGVTVYFSSPGDTLYSVAREFNASLSALKSLNSLPDTLSGGERVVIWG